MKRRCIAGGALLERDAVRGKRARRGAASTGQCGKRSVESEASHTKWGWQRRPHFEVD